MHAICLRSIIIGNIQRSIIFYVRSPSEFRPQRPPRTNNPSHHKRRSSSKIKQPSKDNQPPIIAMVLLLNGTSDRNPSERPNTRNRKGRPGPLPVILRRADLRDTHGRETNRRTAPEPKQHRIADNRRDIIAGFQPESEREDCAYGSRHDHDVETAEFIRYQAGEGTAGDGAEIEEDDDCVGEGVVDADVDGVRGDVGDRNKDGEFHQEDRYRRH